MLTSVRSTTGSELAVGHFSCAQDFSVLCTCRLDINYLLGKPYGLRTVYLGTWSNWRFDHSANTRLVGYPIYIGLTVTILAQVCS